MAPGTVQLSIFSWNAILAKYVKAGQYEKKMGLFYQLQQKGIVLNRSSFVPVLKACASLFAREEGKKIHSLVVESGLSQMSTWEVPLFTCMPNVEA
jgi:pentatricopeptide repeat protein